MKAVIQRVREASITVDEKEVSRIGKGILTLLGIEKGDTEEQATKLIRKICDLRIFEDGAGKMNLSLRDIAGAHLIVSQFTLAGDCSAGRRPSFTGAERPELARALYETALSVSRQTGVDTAAGIFQVDMKVSLVNDGPVTFILGS
ncbi:MAG: D-aminoacyl-tRNA deacylase [Oligoflexia bacterium]|nr:D-aminoacyl-tRNA deacylase [Oligoflexia bacterium]